MGSRSRRAVAGAVGCVWSVVAVCGWGGAGAAVPREARAPADGPAERLPEAHDGGARELRSTRGAGDAAQGAPAPSRRAPVTLAERAGAPGLIAYPPRVEPERGLAVFLHGMCDEPEWECPRLVEGVAEHGWLVCPRASLRCDHGGSIWPGDARWVATLDASVERFEREVEPGAAGAPRTLIGFSLGALRAATLIQRPGQRWRRAILIGAKVQLDPRRLRAAGLERLVLVAGERDMMKWHMVEQARSLARAGLSVAFLSLGPVGHTLPPALPEVLSAALRWVAGDDAALSGPRDRRAGELVSVGGREPGASS